MVVTVVFLLLSLLAGCRRSESVTGTGDGSRSLSGQVVTVGDLSGSSPSGIRVSSNGNVATTDASGRFAFSSLPDKDVQVAFSRNDGVNASANVGASASEVVVQLQKTQAAVVVTGQNKREIEGTIREISSTSITVNDARTKGPITAKIDGSTNIRKGNRTLSTNDLKVGDRVHVRASINADGSLTAVEIKLQEGSGENDGGGQTKELEGPIVSVSSSQITVRNASTKTDVKAAITGQTVIRKGNTTLKPSDLKAGDRVHVKTSGSGDNLTALEIKLQNPGN